MNNVSIYDIVNVNDEGLFGQGYCLTYKDIHSHDTVERLGITHIDFDKYGRLLRRSYA